MREGDYYKMKGDFNYLLKGKRKEIKTAQEILNEV